MAQKIKKRIAIDLVPIRPGKGGTGSGIWTYARELAVHLDQLDDFQGLDVICLTNREQQSAFSNLRNIRCVCFPTFGKSTMLRLAWTHFFLPLWCFFRRIDVLHKPATETPLFCSAQRVTTVHDFFHEFMGEQGIGTGAGGSYFRWMSSVCFRKSRSVIAVSDATRDEARRRFPRSSAVVTTAYNGSFLPAEQRRLHSENGFTILFIAKLMRYKGQLDALKALEVLLGAHPELRGQIRLVFHGFSNDVAYTEQLQRESSRSVFGDAVEFRVYDVDKTLDDLYAEADLLLFLSQYEGFGLPVVEAQARGVPVVCSDIAVLREVGGDGARYVDRENAGEVADAVLTLIQQAPERERLTIAGRENSKRFNWRRTAQETLAVYKKVLG